MCLVCWRMHVVVAVPRTTEWHCGSNRLGGYNSTALHMYHICAVVCDHNDCVSLGRRISTDNGCARCGRVEERFDVKNAHGWCKYECRRIPRSHSCCLFLFYNIWRLPVQSRACQVKK